MRDVVLRGVSAVCASFPLLAGLRRRGARPFIPYIWTPTHPTHTRHTPRHNQLSHPIFCSFFVGVGHTHTLARGTTNIQHQHPGPPGGASRTSGSQRDHLARARGDPSSSPRRVAPTQLVQAQAHNTRAQGISPHASIHHASHESHEASSTGRQQQHNNRTHNTTTATATEQRTILKLLSAALPSING